MPYPCTDAGCPVGPAEHGHLDPLDIWTTPPKDRFEGVVLPKDPHANCRAENAALRRALEVYADRSNWFQTRHDGTVPLDVWWAWEHHREPWSMAVAALARGEPSSDAAPQRSGVDSGGSGA